MKVFARNDRTLFAELTIDEWANLTGYHSDYDRMRCRGQFEVGPGATIDIAKWRDATAFVADESARIEQIRKEFAEQVTRLDAVLAAIGKPRIEI